MTAPATDAHLRELAASSDFELYRRISGSPKGLTENEAAGRLALVGGNSVDEPVGEPLRHSCLRAVRSPFVVLLSGLGAILSALRDWHGAVMVGVMVTAAVALRLWHHRQAARAVHALHTADLRTATVRRRAEERSVPRWREIPATELVPGDVVLLEAGDRVPADTRIVSSIGLSVEQSSVNGEAAPVAKDAATEDGPATPVAALDRLCLAGCAVVSGSAVGVVVATGADTYTGAMWQHTSRTPRRSSFTAGVRSVGWTLVRAMLVMATVVLVVRGAVDGEWRHAAVLAVAVAVGLTPEMLPVVISAALAAGAARLAERRVIAKRLEAIQDLGAMDILCIDKTGTLTEDRVVFAQSVDAAGGPDPRAAQRAAVANLLRHDLVGRFDDAIAAAGVYDVPDDLERVDEIPFDYSRRRSSVVVAAADGRCELICQGDADVIVPRCAAVDVDEAMRLVETYRGAGCGVLAIAVRDVSALPGERRGADDEWDMTLLGFVTFVDPVRENAAESLAELADLGVSVRMLTGDSRAVAVDVARRTGMPCDGMRGRDIDGISDDELRESISAISVFAELTPTHKKRIVEALQARGDVVGFIGDGVNDIAALRAADAGIAMDSAGAAVKDVADVVMADRDLAVLADVVREGRRTLVNIVKYVRITGSSNLGNALSVVIAGLVLPFSPILPGQLLVQNLLYDLAQLALPWDRVGRGRLRSPRRFGRDGLLGFMLTFGALSSVFDAATFAALWWIFGGAHDEAVFRTGWFLEGLLSQLLIVQVLRNGGAGWRRPAPATVVLLAATLVAMVGCLLPYGPLASALRFAPMPADYAWYLVIALVVYGVVAAQVQRWYVGRVPG